MPPENPYAAPQVIDRSVTVLPDLDAELVPSLESIRTGAQLALKATWLLLLACFMVGVCAAMGIDDFVPLMLLILQGAAAFCFLLGLVAFGQVTPAAGIRRLMRIALIAFAVWLLLSLLESWILPALVQEYRLTWNPLNNRMAWNALDNAVSMTYLVSFLWGLARLGRVLHDRIVTRSATVAAWAWGAYYTLVGGAFLLGGIFSGVRDKIAQFFEPSNRPALIAFVSVAGILFLIGLGGMIRALWRLRKLHAVT